MTEQQAINALNELNAEARFIDKKDREAFILQRRSEILKASGYETENAFDVPLNVALAIF